MSTPSKTAFVLAGGGSLGAVQVGMLQALLEHGVGAGLVVGSSVGALNAAYFAAEPTLAGVALHPINLLIAHPLVRDVAWAASRTEVFVVPSLCPLQVSS